VNRSGEVGDDG